MRRLGTLHQSDPAGHEFRRPWRRLPGPDRDWIVTLRETRSGQRSGRPRAAWGHGAAVFRHALNGFTFHGSTEAAAAIVT